VRLLQTSVTILHISRWLRTEPRERVVLFESCADVCGEGIEVL
jgi:hypothetical protein